MLEAPAANRRPTPLCHARGHLLITKSRRDLVIVVEVATRQCEVAREAPSNLLNHRAPFCSHATLCACGMSMCTERRGSRISRTHFHPYGWPAPLFCRTCCAADWQGTYLTHGAALGAPWQA